VIILSIIIFTFSFIISKFFPKRFIHWKNWTQNLKNKKLIDKLIILLIASLLLPPISNFLMSLGLTLFIFSFIKHDVNLLWEEIAIDSEIIYEFLGGVALLPFGLLFSLFVILILPWIFFEKILKKENLLKYVGPIWFVTCLTALEILKDFPLFQKIANIILKISSICVQLIIGIIPLGWFYELFIGSITKTNFLKRKSVN